MLLALGIGRAVLFASSVDREQIADATGDGIDVLFGVDSKAGAGPEVVGECERVVAETVVQIFPRS